MVDHDRQLVAGPESWLPPLEECGEEEREGLHRMMKVCTALCLRAAVQKCTVYILYRKSS